MYKKGRNTNTITKIKCVTKAHDRLKLIIALLFRLVGKLYLNVSYFLSKIMFLNFEFLNDFETIVFLFDKNCGSLVLKKTSVNLMFINIGFEWVYNSLNINLGLLKS